MHIKKGKNFSIQKKQMKILYFVHPLTSMAKAENLNNIISIHTLNR